MKLLQLAPIVLLAAAIPSPAAEQRAHYPPLADYMLPHETEVALADSAAPPHISGGATIKILTASGYQVARKGDNGFVCMVMRGWTAPSYTPVELRGLVYDAIRQSADLFRPRSRAHGDAVLRTPKQARHGGPDAGSDHARRGRGLQEGGSAQAGARVVRVHVVGRPASGTGHRSLASPHDGVRAELSKRGARQQRVRPASALRLRRWRDTVCGGRHTGRRQAGHQSIPGRCERSLLPSPMRCANRRPGPQREAGGRAKRALRRFLMRQLRETADASSGGASCEASRRRARRVWPPNIT